ncbi:hypothetical protein COL922a_014445, partial [Colletotrichum nupharicola]
IANWLLILLYTAGTGIIKLSFSATLWRVVQSKALKIAIVSLAAATIIITVFEFVFVATTCTPIAKLWKPLEVEGTCRPPFAAGIGFLTHGAVLLVVDLALGAIIPVIVLRGLQMSTLLKVSAGLTMAVGS